MHKKLIKKLQFRTLLRAVFFITFLVAFTYIVAPTQVYAQAAFQACIAAGNTPGECDHLRQPQAVFDPNKGPTKATFDFLNPLALGTKADQLSNPGGILSEVLFFSFPLAGLILFVMIVWGGFEIMMGGANKKFVDSGKQRITAAFIGFFLLFSSYWITQIVEVIFGVAIL